MVWISSISFSAFLAVIAKFFTVSLSSLVFPSANLSAWPAASFAFFKNFSASSTPIMKLSIDVFNRLLVIPSGFNFFKISFVAFNSPNIFAAASADLFALSTAFCICWVINTLSIFFIVSIKTLIFSPLSCCALYLLIPSFIIFSIASLSSLLSSLS